MLKIIKQDDSVTTCQCCGKTGLKFTILVEQDGIRKNFGSTCATRHTGMKAGKIKEEIEAHRQSAILSARAELKKTAEYAALQVAYKSAHAAGVVGKKFKEMILEQLDAERAKRSEIADFFGVLACEI